jgi:acryloyl-coenzyme A reductase
VARGAPGDDGAFPLDRFGGPEALARRAVPVPRPGPREVLVRIDACGVCGRDVMRRRGAAGHVLGAVLGHETAGTVAAVGPAATRVAVGDRVAATQRRSCHACDACRAGREVLCEQGRLYGEDLDGGYAEYRVIDELSLAHVPPGVTSTAAAIAACAIGTGLHALRLAGVTAGQRVLVTGASGGVGIHALQLARGLGAETVAITSRPEKAKILGGFADSVVVLDNGHFDRQVRNAACSPT